MNFAKAIKVVSRHPPCGHENHDARLGDGRTWAKCEDCGATFDRALLERRRESVREFGDAIAFLRAAAQAEVDAARWAARVKVLEARLDAVRAAADGVDRG